MVYQCLSEIARKRGLVLKDFAAEYASDVGFDYPKEASGDSVSLSSSQATTTAAEGSQKSDLGRVRRERDGLEPVVPVMRPQYLRAYRYWHEHGMSLGKMCIELSLKGKAGEGLKPSTVMFVHLPCFSPVNESDRLLDLISSYVVGALQADSTLPFKISKLRELVQMDGASWVRHREWILRAWAEGKGLPVEE
jgi:hypothetical protein